MVRALLFEPPADRPFRIVALGAHSDDLEIGCAGLVMRAIEELPAVEVCWAVAGAVGERAEEATNSATELLAGASDVRLVLGSFADGYMPYVGGDVKRWVHALADAEPDLVVVHQRDDLHQDHRLLAELALNEFRDQLILGYEVPKYDGDLGAPNVFVPLSVEMVERKLAQLDRHFGSQRNKDWFDRETFRGLMRLRGVESRAEDGYAEAFYVRKAVVGFPSEPEA